MNLFIAAFLLFPAVLIGTDLVPAVRSAVLTARDAVRETARTDRLAVRRGYRRALYRGHAGDVEWARAELARLVEARPEDAVCRCALGEMQLRAGHEEEAEGEFLRALSLDPADAHALHSLGEYYRARGDREVAAHLLAASLAIKRDARTLIVYGDVLTESGELDGAIQAFLDALARRPRDEAAQRGLMRALRRRSGGPEP